MDRTPNAYASFMGGIPEVVTTRQMRAVEAAGTPALILVNRVDEARGDAIAELEVAFSKIEPGKVFDKRLPLEEAAEAYRLMDQREAIKVLLEV